MGCLGAVWCMVYCTVCTVEVRCWVVWPCGAGVVCVENTELTSSPPPASSPLVPPRPPASRLLQHEQVKVIPELKAAEDMEGDYVELEASAMGGPAGGKGGSSSGGAGGVEGEGEGDGEDRDE